MKTPNPASIVATFVSAVLSLILPASAMSAPRTDPFHDDPILVSRWGPGDPDLAVSRFRFELDPKPRKALEQQPSTYDLGIVAPAGDETVFSDPGDVSVQATIAPALADGDRIEFLLDGEPVGPPSTALGVPLSGVVRGEHLIQARIIDSTGNVGSASPSTVFYMR